MDSGSLVPLRGDREERRRPCEIVRDIALVAPIAVPGAIRTYHGPALAAAVGLLGILLIRGRLGRPEGARLIAAYEAYLLGVLVGVS